MAKKNITKQRKISTKKKRWYKIVAPKVFNSAVVGETPAVDETKLPGRVVTMSLGSVINNPRKHNTTIKLKITDVSGNDAKTDLVGYELNAGQVKRFVRRNRNRVDDSFVCESKDGVKVRLKPLLLTRGLATKQTLTDLRKASKEVLTEYAKGKEYGQIVGGIISAEPQKMMKEKLRKIHPLTISEIRVLKKEA